MFVPVLRLSVLRLYVLCLSVLCLSVLCLSVPRLSYYHSQAVRYIKSLELTSLQPYCLGQSVHWTCTKSSPVQELCCTVPSLNCDVHCTVPHPLPPAGIKCLSSKIKCIPNTKDVRFVKFYKWKINGSATIEFKQLNLHFNFWNAVVMGIEIWKWKFELFKNLVATENSNVKTW